MEPEEKERMRTAKQIAHFMLFGEQEQMLSVKEVAHFTKVSTRTVMRWLEDGKLRGLRLGGVIRIHPNDLEDFFIKSTIVSTTQGDQV